MTGIVKETVTTQTNTSDNAHSTSVSGTATTSQTLEYIVYFFFGVLEVLLVFRLILKVMGAGVSSSFVSWIYGLSGIFIVPFEGIFRRGYAQGVETTSVLEPSTIVAILVYAVLAWGAIKLVRILSGARQ